MGGCLSSLTRASPRRPNLEVQTIMANVISVNGQLRQYTAPIQVCQVLFNILDESSKLRNYSGLSLLCNSDSLYYNESLQPMDMEEELQAGQIYFLLPSSKFGYPLSASDMAALAVKASIALNRIPPVRSNSNRDHLHRCQNKINRISPVLESLESKKNIKCESSSYGDREQMAAVKKGDGYVRKIQKLRAITTRRRRSPTKAGSSSNKVNLSTIYEGYVLV